MGTGYKLLALALAAAALVGGGYRWGDTARDNAWQAQDAKRVQQEAKAREQRLIDERAAQDAEFKRADRASAELQARLRDQAATNDQLTKAFNDYKRRNPILARSPLGPADAQPAQAAPAAAGEIPAGNDAALSFGAVWMWNSALAGGDRPAGACGLAGATESACAADSGVRLEDAWDNQALNGRIWAEDRIRHQRLIDHVQEYLKREQSCGRN